MNYTRYAGAYLICYAWAWWSAACRALALPVGGCGSRDGPQTAPGSRMAAYCGQRWRYWAGGLSLVVIEVNGGLRISNRIAAPRSARQRCVGDYSSRCLCEVEFRGALLRLVKASFECCPAKRWAA